jgi:hypothetical protein
MHRNLDVEKSGGWDSKKNQVEFFARIAASEADNVLSVNNVFCYLETNQKGEYKSISGCSFVRNRHL